MASVAKGKFGEGFVAAAGKVNKAAVPLHLHSCLFTYKYLHKTAELRSSRTL